MNSKGRNPLTKKLKDVIIAELSSENLSTGFLQWIHCVIVAESQHHQHIVVRQSNCSSVHFVHQLETENRSLMKKEKYCIEASV